MATKKQKKRKGTGLLIFMFLLVILLGIAMVVYPLFASWYSEQTRSLVQSEYDEQIKQIDTAEIQKVKAAAIQYNKDLVEGKIDIMDPTAAGYYTQLNPTGKDIMGYIEIPRLKLYLPIYHGIDSVAMSNGCGHMPQSSLPVGGESTHSVISAHSGMATPMFSDLDKMQPGDLFFLHILDETLTYQVDTITTTVPQDIDPIKIQTGKDLCSLITCYPFGINTHRLIVLGFRVETPTQEQLQEMTPADDTPTEDANALWMKRYMTGILIGLCVGIPLVILLILVKLSRNRKQRKARMEKAWLENAAMIATPVADGKSDGEQGESNESSH